MDRRVFLGGLLAGAATGQAALAQAYSDGWASPRNPYHVLPPNADTAIIPPGEGTIGWDPYDPYAAYDSNAPTQASIETLKLPRWDRFFDSPAKGMIVCSIAHRVVHFRSEDGLVQRAYLSSVPRGDDYARRGRTTIVHKRHLPTWIPTPDMRKIDPTLPKEVGPGPDNPLGTRALNLGWTYYRIHGIDRPEKVGQPVSSGCFGLYNHAIEELYEMVQVGTQVVVI